MAYSYADQGERTRVLKDVRRVVLKVGTRLLTDMPDVPKAERVTQLVDAIAALHDRGYEVILVSSGAIGAGMTVLQTPKRPHSLPQLQAHAAVGQSRLMYLYETAAARHGFHCAQLLLTAADVKDRVRHLNVVNCLDALLAAGVLPVVNENDSVSVEEIRFGDNDALAALVASMIRADLTVLLTSVDGMHERTDRGWGRRMSVVPGITTAIRQMAGGTDGNRFSTGGMQSKLQAVEIVTRAGEPAVIADGRDFATLAGVFDGRDCGTLFLPTASQRMRARKRYLAFFSKTKGDILVDAGAESALTQKGRSLLPSGIVAVRETFERGDTVRILSVEGIEIARGESNYGSAEVDAIKGCKSQTVRDILGYEGYDAVVHRDAMVLTGTPSGEAQDEPRRPKPEAKHGTE